MELRLHIATIGTNGQEKMIAASLDRSKLMSRVQDYQLEHPGEMVSVKTLIEDIEKP